MNIERTAEFKKTNVPEGIFSAHNNGKEIIIWTEQPGYRLSDFSVKVTKDQLTVSAPPVKTIVGTEKKGFTFSIARDSENQIPLNNTTTKSLYESGIFVVTIAIPTEMQPVELNIVA